MSNSNDSAPLDPGNKANFTRVFAAISMTDTSFDGRRFRKLWEYREMRVVVLTTSPLIKHSGKNEKKLNLVSFSYQKKMRILKRYESQKTHRQVLVTMR